MVPPCTMHVDHGYLASSLHAYSGKPKFVSSADLKLVLTSGGCLSVDSNPSSKAFQTNLRLLLTSLISKAHSTSGFYNNSIGETPDRVYGLVLCRGDVASDMCLNCLINITNDITRHCMDSTQGVAWYDHCLVRYNNHEFFGVIDTGRFFQIQNWTRKEHSKIDPRRFLWGLVESAPSQPLMFSMNKLEVKKDYLSQSETRYGLVQCTRDLNRHDCRTCLNELMKDYKSCCEGMRRWRIIAGSCSIWYDDRPFFFELGYSESLRMLGENKNYITYGSLFAPSAQPYPSRGNPYERGNLSSPAPQTPDSTPPITTPALPPSISNTTPATTTPPPPHSISNATPATTTPPPAPASISNTTPATATPPPPLTSLPTVTPGAQPPLAPEPTTEIIIGPSISSNFSGLGPKVPRKKAHFPLVIIGVSIPGILIFMAAVVLLFFLYRRKSNNKTTITKDVETFLKNNGSLGPKRYKYSELKKMTNSFRDEVGHGGFGCVFKGRLPDGRLVAVKVLSESKGNGQDFINEVASIGKTYHVNVVSLLGFCFEGFKRALIYEYMPNGSLDRYIYGEKPRSMNPLGWDKLYKIALEIARGLEYLHVRCSMRILHLDIKPHNILLDENFCPKISDFGLAKLCPTKESTISSLTPRGTIGYTAPEVHCRNFGGVSYKSDVYSYGMMVLEMVGGRRNIDAEAETSQIYFPQWIYKCLNQQGSDIRVEGLATGAEEEMARKMILVGLWCIQMSPVDRPSMSRVVEIFQGSIEDVPMPPNPFPPRPS
ncbi:LEAF RUST 10 DISEASE-RESISTANCE LOCUS RECEPTOR-LIKE PROTEIN KINASE-like protein 2.4 [Cinnamomum micranthum f. kanehirae]|uniref:LEAF RUST 10 DISEASE-RESISTANCE LOCUS RECEPTOR-LIKE PROTEIN KINASE-like protein 2.4 n=2 Tax=Lauraceae TaxID=3433 RepID=A0A3S3PZF5_9MAGN|nr:LEAF RUST 10 DISEASE-RESISTANCE LOCUS RECEPTOR-LIKE PROTEIN KINASE-like protein 2.4 [Cinnamomum micranthum f. kanehirae]